MPEFLLHVHPCAFKCLYYLSTPALLKPERIGRGESVEDVAASAGVVRPETPPFSRAPWGPSAAAQPGWKIQHVVHAFCANVSQLRHSRL